MKTAKADRHILKCCLGWHIALLQCSLTAWAQAKEGPISGLVLLCFCHGLLCKPLQAGRIGSLLGILLVKVFGRSSIPREAPIGEAFRPQLFDARVHDTDLVELLNLWACVLKEIIALHLLER